MKRLLGMISLLSALVVAASCAPTAPVGPTASTLAGTAGVAGLVDGPAATAEFDLPGGVAADATGNTFVADTANNSIREVSAAGVVSTLAGCIPGDPCVAGFADGSGAAAQFDHPTGIVTDPASSDLFVTDTNNNAIRRVTQSGIVSTFVGCIPTDPCSPGFVNGAGAAARFAHPTGIAIDGLGNLWVADTGNSAIRHITAGGGVATYAGNGQAGNSDAGSGQFDHPTGVTVGNGDDIVVADTGNNSIRLLHPLESIAKVATIAPAGCANTGAPCVAGSVDSTLATAGFNHPQAVVAGSDCAVFVADTTNHTVRALYPPSAAQPAGQTSTLAGVAGQPGADNSIPGNPVIPGNPIKFNQPSGIAITAAGKLTVADTANHLVRSLIPGNPVIPGNPISPVCAYA